MPDPLRVTFAYTPEDDHVDPDHETGLTEDGFTALTDALMELGAEDVEVRRPL